MAVSGAFAARLDFGWSRRVPMILQTEAAECALASLAMVSGYFGGVADLARLRRQAGASLKGASLRDVIAMAERLGLASRALRVEIEELRMLKTPCILHWDMNHFVVLVSVGAAHAVIHDPAFGVRRTPMKELSRHFTGVALELVPTSTFEPAGEAPRVRLASVLGRTVGLTRSLAQLFTLAFALEVFAVASPLLLQLVVDHVLVTADEDLLVTLGLGFLLLVILRAAVSAMRGWIVMVVGSSLKVQGRANLFSHLVNLPTSFFEARHLGDVLSRFNSQDTIFKAITTDMVEAVLDGLLAVVTLAIMFAFSPTLTFVVLAGAALYGLLRWFAYTPLRHASMEGIVWSTRRDSNFLETLRGIKTLKLFNAQETRRAQWLNLLVEAVNRDITVQRLRVLFQTANLLLTGTLTVLVVWIGARHVLASSLTVGMLIAFVAYKDQFLDRVSSLIDKAVDLTMLRLHAERLADIALTAPEPREPLSELPLPAAPVGIEARDVRFRYSDREPWVLDKVSFRVEAGGCVAIVGPSGCGKTTLLKIMASLLDPVGGELLVEGVPVSRFGVERWRSLIGVVMQDDQLFAGSIAENIAFFAERPDRALVEECARAAAIHDEIVAMPMGYATLIGDMGAVLSGGQKQRVLIARALYRRPRVLLLDEATSHLDLRAEAAVNHALRGLRMTRVVIAHRPETIRSADRVIDLRDPGLDSIADGMRGAAAD